MATGIASRLQYLFSTVRRPDGRTWTLREVAEGTGLSISYLWRLRAGRTDNPTKAVLERLGQFFGVPASFFTADESDMGRILGRSDAAEQTSTQLDACAAMAQEGRLAEAERLAQVVLTQAWSMGDRVGTGRALTVLGQVARLQGDLESAWGSLQRALESLEGPHSGVAWVIALHELAVVEWRRERFSEAYAGARRALDATRLVNVPEGVQQDVLLTAGVCARRVGLYQEALEWFRLAQAIAEKRQDRLAEARIALGAGLAKVDEGSVDEAIPLLEKALRSFISLRLPQEVADAQHNIGIAYQRVKRWPEGVEALTKSLGSHEALGEFANVIYDEMELGLCYAHLGQIPQAVAHAERALQLAEQHGRSGDTARVNLHLARIHACGGDSERALAYYAEAIERFTKLELSVELARARVEYGDFLSRHKRTHQALGEYRAAIELLMAERAPAPSPVIGNGGGPAALRAVAGGAP